MIGVALPQITEDFGVDLAQSGYARVEELNRRYADLELGFVDAAVVAISEALEVPRVATTDSAASTRSKLRRTGIQSVLAGVKPHFSSLWSTVAASARW